MASSFCCDVTLPLVRLRAAAADSPVLTASHSGGFGRSAKLDTCWLMSAASCGDTYVLCLHRLVRLRCAVRCQAVAPC